MPVIFGFLGAIETCAAFRDLGGQRTPVIRILIILEILQTPGIFVIFVVPSTEERITLITLALADDLCTDGIELVVLIFVADVPDVLAEVVQLIHVGRPPLVADVVAALQPGVVTVRSLELLINGLYQAASKPRARHGTHSQRKREFHHRFFFRRF